MRTLCLALVFVISSWSAAFAETARIQAQSANLRVAPTLQSAVVVTLARGTLLEVIEWSGSRFTWARVAVPDRAIEGYIYGALVESVQEKNKTPNPAESEVTVAQDKGSTGSSTPASPRNLRLSGYETALPAYTDSVGERAAWSYKLQDAKRKKKRGTTFLITGGGLIAVGLLTKATQGDYQRMTLGFVSDVTLFVGGGVAMGGYGILARSKAGHEITALEAEGRQNGFAGLTPPSGVRLAFRVSF